jgi:hypothetical protein
MAGNSITLADASELLGSCTGVVDLVVWTSFARFKPRVKPYRDTDLLEVLTEEEERLVAEFFTSLNSCSRLRDLWFVYENLAILERSNPSTPPAWCADLKYLDLMYRENTGRVLPVPLLRYMERLTHLSLTASREPNAKPEFDVSAALRTRPTLEVVLILMVNGIYASYKEHTPPDVRVVYYTSWNYLDSWKNQDDSRWIAAEEEIAQRRKLGSYHRIGRSAARQGVVFSVNSPVNSRKRRS